MSFIGKLINVIQASVLTVTSIAITLAIAAATIYEGSRAVDWTFNLPKHTSISWLGNHATQIAEGTRALLNIAIATGITNHSAR